MTQTNEANAKLAWEVEQLRGELHAAQETIQARTSWANCGGVPTGIKCRVDGHEIYGGFQADKDRNNAICDIHLIQEITEQLRAAVEALRSLQGCLADTVYVYGAYGEIWSKNKPVAALDYETVEIADIVAAYDAQHPEVSRG